MLTIKYNLHPLQVNFLPSNLFLSQYVDKKSSYDVSTSYNYESWNYAVKMLSLIHCSCRHNLKFITLYFSKKSHQLPCSVNPWPLNFCLSFDFTSNACVHFIHPFFLLCHICARDKKGFVWMVNMERNMFCRRGLAFVLNLHQMQWQLFVNFVVTSFWHMCIYQHVRE